MVLGLLLREDEERVLTFDFEALLPTDEAMDDDGGHGGRKDFKRGTVVCRHWLRALCMKGDSCEFLHQYDMSRMPECRWGMECQVPECPFRHVPDEERVECAFYKQGFCSHGSSCRYRHIKLAREECPETADFTLQSKVADEENVKRRKAQPVNEFYKIAICKHWEKQGSCPFGDECHFAHGEKELRPFPKGEKDARGGGRDNHHHHHQHHGPRGGDGASFVKPERPPAPRMVLPGFIFACNNATIDECFGRMIFGLAKDQEANAAKQVVPGAPLFLLNMSDRHLLGIFEAVSPIVMNLAPGAFSNAPNTPSPFPVQVHFAVSLNAPAISSADPQIQSIVGDRGVRMGALTLEVTQQLADVFAERSVGAFPPPNQQQMRGMGMPPPHMGGGGSSGGDVPMAPGGAGSASSALSSLPKDPNGPGFLEKMVVGIENESEFSVTRRIIGHAGANMKRISAEAGGGAKIRVRGRGSGSKEGGVEEMNEPLVVLVSADNERSFRIAYDLTSELLAGIHHDYRGFLAQKAQRGQHHFPHNGAGGGGGGGGFPLQFQGGPPLHGDGGGFPPARGGSPPGQSVKQEPPA